VIISVYPLATAETRAALRQSLKSRSERFRGWLESAQLGQVVLAVERDPAALADLLPLIGDAAAPMSARIGASAVLERYAGTSQLDLLTPRFSQLTKHTDARVRADVCYFLGLGRSPEAIPFLEACRDDADAEVREIAAESLAALKIPK
jgi:HEAT repeat protein